MTEKRHVRTILSREVGSYEFRVMAPRRRNNSMAETGKRGYHFWLHDGIYVSVLDDI